MRPSLVSRVTNGVSSCPTICLAGGGQARAGLLDMSPAPHNPHFTTEEVSMGYAHYTLPDGREAGYAVAAICDADRCTTKIDRGLDYLCGSAPDGWRDDEEPGCGRYFCGEHDADHDCPHPECGMWDTADEAQCYLAAGHEQPHSFG